MPKPMKALDAHDIGLVIEVAAAKARESFAAFRRFMNPEILWGWWTQELAEQLQGFWEDLVAGRRPKLALMAPPQHGKSTAITDFIAWAAGKNPDWKVIFASFGDELGVNVNVNVQRMMKDERYSLVFPDTRIGVTGWHCNNDPYSNIPAHKGSFRNTTVYGAVTGHRLDLGVIDDPVKGRQEAE